MLASWSTSIARAIRVSAAFPLSSQILSQSSLRYRHIKGVQRDRHEGIEPDQIGQFGCAMLAEGLDRCSVGEFREHPPIHQRACKIICNRLLSREIDGTLSDDNGRKLLVREPPLLTDEHMS